MSADYFIHILREHEIADLRSCINAAYWLESMSVPKADTSISCASSRSEKSVLVRAPTYSFDCCSMIREFDKRGFSTLEAPYH